MGNLVNKLTCWFCPRCQHCFETNDKDAPTCEKCNYSKVQAAPLGVRIERYDKVRANGYRYCSLCNRPITDNRKAKDHLYMNLSQIMDGYTVSERRNCLCQDCKTKKSRKKNYGISPLLQEQILRDQGGKCAICGDEIHGYTSLKDKSKRTKACLDHDHETGEVRGLLCSRCNTGIGFLRDSPNIVALAFEYLKKYKFVPQTKGGPE